MLPTETKAVWIYMKLQNVCVKINIMVPKYLFSQTYPKKHTS